MSGVIRGDTTSEERFAKQMGRSSARQRLLVLTFDTIEEAEAFDACGDDMTALRRLLVK